MPACVHSLCTTHSLKTSPQTTRINRLIDRVSLPDVTEAVSMNWAMLDTSDGFPALSFDVIATK